MGADEEGTLRRYMSDIQDIIQPRISEHHGSVVKTTGDGVMAIFQSAFEAVKCARQVQHVLEASSSKTPPESLIYRIGINVGEIIVETNDIYGDAVNVAARLEGLAEPGGIALSGSAYWSIKSKCELSFEELGFLNLKNILEPIEVYRVAGMSQNFETELRQQTAPESIPAPRRVWSEDSEHHASIIVLPFENLSRDPEQDYFCEGVTSDLTTDLSKFAHLMVISSNSAFSYRGKKPSPEALRRELGVDFVLEGSVQRHGSKVRVNIQLSDTAQNKHLWAERIQREVDDLFELQDQVVCNIVATLASKIGVYERERAARIDTSAGSAYDMFLRGLYFMNRFLGNDEAEDTLGFAQSFFEKTHELDDRHARAWGWRAYILVLKWMHGWADESVLADAEAMARKGVSLGPHDHDTHWALGCILSNTGQFDKALVEYHRALDINPNDADVHAEMAELLSFMGRHHDAIGQIRYAMNLNPHFQDWYRSILGWAFHFAREYDDAITEISTMVSPSDEEYLVLAASHVRRADIQEADGNPKQADKDRKAASANIKKFLKRRPGWTVERHRAVTRFRSGEDLEYWLEGLAMAGLPES